ncbi:MAG: UDP-N-acetylmuramate dehydrogenase [Desulfobacula sp.]|nr:UDP-N-acetylmuramate dehydrogenase [Desulfobacula sp.]
MATTKDIKYAAMAQTFGLLRDEPLKPYTSFKVGGPADLLALPKTVEELTALLGYASQQNIPVTLLGGGTNVLVSDKGIRGLVIVTTGLKSGIRITDSTPEKALVDAAAGERLSTVCRFALDHSLSGLEFAAGIPGTLGGALAMNAGTKAGDMSGIIRDIKILDFKTLNLEILERKKLDFSYRCLKLSGIIVAATLALKPGNRTGIEQTVQANLSFKKATQPISVASAGCFFKNPVQGMPAGELIEKSGLKGTDFNGARVSDLHANYIINTGNATCDDILRLKQHIQDTVFNAFKIKLETEVRIEGE